MELTKESALTKLDNLINETHILQEHKRFSEAHMFWIAETLRFLEKVFGKKSRYYLTFASFTWSKMGQFVVGGPSRPAENNNPQRGIERVHQEVYINELKTARGLLSAAKNELNESDLNEVYQGDELLAKKNLTSINFWNYVNPVWLLWKLLALFCKRKIISTIITGLIIAYIVFILGWNK